MCQDRLPAAFRAEKKRAVTYDSFNCLVVYSLWLWVGEFCDKFAAVDRASGRSVSDFHQGSSGMALRLCAGLSPEKSEALLNCLWYFYFPIALVSFIVAYRLLFLDVGPSPARALAAVQPMATEAEGSWVTGQAGSEDGGARIAGVGSSERGAPKKPPEGKRKVGPLAEKGSEASAPLKEVGRSNIRG